MLRSQHQCWLFSLLALLSLAQVEAYATEVDWDKIRPTDIELKQERPEIVEAIATGLRQWKEQVVFRCSYRLRLGGAYSLSDALAGRFYDPTENKPMEIHPLDSESADGVVAKDTDAFLLRYKRVGPTYSPTPSNLTNPSFVVGVGNGVEAVYWLRQKTTLGKWYGNQVDFRLLRDESVESRFPQEGPVVMPLYACGGEDRSIFADRESDQLTTLWGVKTVAPSRLLIAIEYRRKVKKGDASSTESPGHRMEYIVRTDGRFPVIERRVFWEVEDGVVGSANPMIMSEFRDLGDGMLIAARITELVTRHSADRKIVNVKFGDTYYAAHYWVSNDIGKRAPTSDDFIIKVPKGVRVRNYRGKNLNVLNVKKFSPSDVGGGSSAVQGSPSAETQRPSSGQVAVPSSGLTAYFAGSFVRPLALALVVCGGILIVWARRFRYRQA